MHKLQRTAAGLMCCLITLASPAASEDVDYRADMQFALEEIKNRCGHFFQQKGIDWKAVSKEMNKRAKAVSNDQEHLVLLWELMARLRDGHAQVRPLEKGKDVQWPEEPERVGPGFFLCRVGKKIYLKNAWGDGAAAGLKPGMELLKVDGTGAAKWLEKRTQELSQRISFSTPHHASFYAAHQGLSQPKGTRMKLELKDSGGKKRKRTLTYNKSNPTPWGPAFFPPGVQSVGRGDVYYGMMEGGWGYIQVRRCKSALPEHIDQALATVGEAPGLVLDFRGNSGGGFDHDAVLGRFVPQGKSISFAKTIPSAGPHPYGGPVVVIVDATCRSAGETGSGMFKEDGRAYMIGESPTAGMSSQKTTINLPSGLFSLYVSIASNKSRFQDGRGIEGIGIEPHELVAFDPKDLANEKDTLILRAAALLADFPQRKVPYDPKDFK